MASSMPSWSAVIEEPSALQIRMKLLQGQSHAPFDRAQWHPDHLGDLAMRVTPKVRELDGLTLLGRQAGQRLLDHVLGPPRVAHDAQGDGEGQRTVLVVEARQRVDVPRIQSFSDV